MKSKIRANTQGKTFTTELTVHDLINLLELEVLDVNDELLKVTEDIQILTLRDSKIIMGAVNKSIEKINSLCKDIISSKSSMTERLDHTIKELEDLCKDLKTFASKAVYSGDVDEHSS